MPVKSPEILAVARRLHKAVAQHDADTMINMIADDDCFCIIGSGENEMWTGRSVREGLYQHLTEGPKIIKTKEVKIEAFQAGDVGWSATDLLVWFDGKEEPVSFRSTYVFELQYGVWKLIHRHGSLPRPNTELHGKDHKLMHELAELARVGFSLDQTEGIASVMFTDVVDSTTLANALGDRNWTRAMGSHLAMIGRVVDTHGGQLVISLGDGTMSSFESATDALHAAIQIQAELAAATAEPRLSARIGVHSGDVIQTKDDFFGAVVNKAARVAAEAAGGAIIVSDVTHAMVGGAAEFQFQDPISVPLRGLDGLHDLFELHTQD